MFVKEPVLGAVKTRLAKESSAEFALDVYKNCVKDLLNTLTDFEFVLYSYPHVNFYEQSDVYLQVGESLGDKMFHAFEEQFAKGYERIILIGSDSPQLPQSLILKSFEVLDSKKVVIGPSLDGGYYLIALQKEALKKELFEEIMWSSEWVLEQTLQKVNEKELYLLEYLNDIDTLTDLNAFYKKYHQELCHSNTIRFLKENGYEKL